MRDTLLKSDGTKVKKYLENSNEAIALLEEIKSNFNWFDRNIAIGIYDKYIHEYLNKNVITVCVQLNYAKTMIIDEFALAHQLFDVDTNTSMLYVTRPFIQDKPSWAQQDMFILACTDHYQELDRPYNPKMLEFKEYFFVAPTVTLNTMEYDLTDINNDTVFSVLVANNEIVAKRRYTNFIPEDISSFLANWQAVYVLYLKKMKRLDLAKTLFTQLNLQ